MHSPVNLLLQIYIVYSLQVLNDAEKTILRNEWCTFDDEFCRQIDSLSKAVGELTALWDTEKRVNKDAWEKNHNLQLQMDRLVTAHGYAEDRITFLA